MAQSRPFLIGVSGGSASGKTSVCEMIMDKLGSSSSGKVLILHQDSFYKVLSEEQKALASRDLHNFDHPDAFDDDVLYNTLLSLQKRTKVHIPTYEFKTHSRLERTTLIDTKPDVIMIEGILVLFNKKIRDLLDMKIFVDTDPDTCLARRIKRDMTERDRTLDSVLKQYMKFVKPSYDDYIFPTRKYADVIVPRGKENLVAIELISVHVHRLLSNYETNTPNNSTNDLTN